MAKSEPAIDPKNQDSILKNPTLPIIEENSGPRVYDEQTPSLNGIDPNYYKQNGVCHK
jgi:hypothetical protein